MKSTEMKAGLALSMQILLAVAGAAVLGFLLVEPHFEGRNVHATVFEIYFEDPFLAYVYLGSVPFFVALHRAFRLFGGVRRRGRFSPDSLLAVQTIRVCALTVLGFVAGAAVFVLWQGDDEDRPAGVFMCMLVAGAAGLLAGLSGWFMRRLRSALARG